MKKIPTLFVRDPEDMRYVTDQVTPGCEWVLAGEGVATRKYDGTCVMFDGEEWWARREVKPGKMGPRHFLAIDMDTTTGKTVGWEPIAQSPFAKFHVEAMEFEPWYAVGTYELCGPKINGNPEGSETHVLVPHFEAEVFAAPRDFAALRDYMTNLGYEGVVWHHPDGRMAKLKAKDFPR